MDVCMEKRNEPLLLRPAGKDYLWGGKRLNDEYGKNIVGRNMGMFHASGWGKYCVLWNV